MSAPSRRHFSTKEAVVADDDPFIAELIRGRPPEGSPHRLRRALAEGIAAVYDSHRDVLLARV